MTVLGVVLAGGLGRRIGGAKALVQLCGIPLLSYPVHAMRAALDEVVILAKVDTELPSLPGVTVWIESALTRHPLVGLTEALGLAGGRAVLVCAGDLPFVSPETIGAIARSDPGEAPAVVASCAGVMQPLLGCYQPRAAALLPRAGAADGVRLREAVAAIGPRIHEVRDPDELFNVNAPEDLLTAAAMLDRRRADHPNVKS